MGVDLTSFTGRIKKKEPSISGNDLVMSHLALSPDDVEIVQVDRRLDGYRSYDLFGFLGYLNWEMKLVPMLSAEELVDVRHHHTVAFVRAIIATRAISPFGCWFSESDHGNAMMYTLKELTDFDYDQCALMTLEGIESGKSYRSDKTYRDLFPQKYFAFLDHCVKEEWEFVVFFMTR